MFGSRTIILPTSNNGSKISASIEMTPKHALEMSDLDTIIPAKTRVYITDLATHSSAAMAKACENLANQNLIAVPHIAARRTLDRANLEDRVKRYADAGVDDVLVVGGSPERLAGEMTSTMDVLATGILDAYGITNIAVAGHPEGSPDFSDEVAIAALRLKKQFAERSDAKLRIVTQFGFDPEVFINWAEGLTDNGIDLPVHLGVAGPAKITTLIKYAAMCGVGNSIDFLKKRASILTALTSSHSAEGVVGPIEAHVMSAEKTAIRGIHAFPFGGVKKTAEWLVDRGSWEKSLPRFQVANQA
jgi:methylenetetrahydrofolate reductase (NADPH)